MAGLLAGLEASALAAEIRRSTFLYPLANVVHILAMLVLFAAVAAMDFRVFTATTIASAQAFIKRIRPVAIVAFLFQVASGAMLLAPEASHIFVNPIFRIKLLAILAGLANVIVLEVMLRQPGSQRLTTGLRVAAGVSLAVWLSVAGLGRLIAYF